jgi:hypothetical protein
MTGFYDPGRTRSYGRIKPCGDPGLAPVFGSYEETAIWDGRSAAWIELNGLTPVCSLGWWQKGTGE